VAPRDLANHRDAPKRWDGQVDDRQIRSGLGNQIGCIFDAGALPAHHEMVTPLMGEQQRLTLGEMVRRRRRLAIRPAVTPYRQCDYLPNSSAGQSVSES
jgi:hypothetical protein